MTKTVLIAGSLVASLLVAGCDDTSGTGGAGGAGSSSSTSSKSGSTSGSSMTTTSTTTTTSGSTSGSGSSSSSGGGNCITLDPGTLTPGGANNDILASMPTLGDPALLDEFDIQFYGTPYVPELGTFDLASAGANDNFATCAHCVYLYRDVDMNVEDKFFFQSEGTLAVTDIDATVPNISQGTLTNVKLVEVTVDQNFISTPVPGGECYFIPSLAWDTKP